MLTQTPDQLTPLYQAHLQAQARMVSFGGWQMPLQYAGILAEYEQTRHAVTMFDTSHMGEFFVEGDPAVNGLDRLVTQRIVDMPLKSCRYGFLLNEQGGVMDDLIVYRLAAERWMLVVNAATMAGDARHCAAQLRPGTFVNRSAEFGKLDVQGPESRAVLKKIIVGIENLDYYQSGDFSVLGQEVVVSRTGYTGELGYEIYYPWDRLPDLWACLLELGVPPAGLGVRDVLRIEMGYALYGHELTEAVNPLDAGLARFIDWDKDFIGRAALCKIRDDGVTKKSICLVSDSRRAPRQGNTIYLASGEAVGEVTSGTFSPDRKRGVGLATVAAGRTALDQQIFFGSGENHLPARVARRPVYQSGSLKD